MFFDKMITKNSNIIDQSVIPEEYSSFFHPYLCNVSSLLLTISESEARLNSAIELCSNNLKNLLNIIKEDDFRRKILDTTIQLIIDIKKPESATELTKLIEKVYLIYDVHIRRQQASICICTTPKNKTTSVVKATEAINNHIRDVLPRCQPCEIPKYDPLMLNIDELDDFEQFLDARVKQFPTCVCNSVATYFAYPCQCPIWCDDCVNKDWIAKSKECPRCSRQITSFVHLED